MIRRVVGLALLSLNWCSFGSEPPVSAATVAGELREASLDPSSCFRIRDVEFQREDLRFYLSDGYLIFSKPIQGRRLFAVFAGRETGDEGEVLMRPPNRGERTSLSSFTDSPNLDEHFRTAVFVFTDSTVADIEARWKETAMPKTNPDMGLLLADDFNGILRNIATSFAVRLVEDIISANPPADGFFFSAIVGAKLGNFDLMVDPTSREQVVAGQVTERNSTPIFNVWASFESRASKRDSRPPRETCSLKDFQIEATIDTRLLLTVVTRMNITAKREGLRAIGFEIAPAMEISSATLDGAPVEIFRRESMRDTLIHGSSNDQILAVFPAGLQAGKSYSLEFHHQGKVITSAGRNVFAVRNRMNWYPNHGLQFAKYDLTFRAPKDLDVVSTGELIDEKVEGEWRVTHRRTSAPVRFAGFNLGAYRRAKVQRGGYTVEICANRSAEEALQQKSAQLVVVPTPQMGPGRRQEVMALPPPPPPDPTARLTAMANDVAGDLDWMAKNFGPPPLPVLTVSPIPGSFGQGFPGLIYLSTMAFLREEDRPAYAKTSTLSTFYSELLHAHETAHQWWGNLVTAATYHDEWLMEAIANYTALMAAERRKGSRALDEILDEYAKNLKTPTLSGKNLESTGPITWGQRLQATPGAWRVITYEKGSWIMHMLRARMGDAKFLAFLKALREKYEYGSMTTEDFRKVAVEYVPKGGQDDTLEAFFDQWVYSTGVPQLELTWSLKGKAPNLYVAGAVKQKGVPDDYSVDLPVEIHFPGQKPMIQWVRTSSEPVPFTAKVKAPPQKVELGAVLRYK